MHIFELPSFGCTCDLQSGLQAFHLRLRLWLTKRASDFNQPSSIEFVVNPFSFMQRLQLYTVFI